MQSRIQAVAIGGALGLFLVASSAGAQDYGPYQPGYYPSPPQEVIVRPPPQRHSFIRAPIIDVSMSRPVRYDDLDLRTGRGAQVLQSRIVFAAHTLCRHLNSVYPVTYDGGSDQWPIDHRCYRDALDGGMAQADQAIRAARGEYGGY